MRSCISHSIIESYPKTRMWCPSHDISWHQTALIVWRKLNWWRVRGWWERNVTTRRSWLTNILGMARGSYSPTSSRKNWQWHSNTVSSTDDNGWFFKHWSKHSASATSVWPPCGKRARTSDSPTCMLKKTYSYCVSSAFVLPPIVQITVPVRTINILSA